MSVHLWSFQVKLHQRLTILGLIALISWPSDVNAQSWSDKLTTTPSLIQDGFGSGGNGLAYNGLLYCVPTSAAMSIQFLGKNGYDQLSPLSPEWRDRFLAGSLFWLKGSGAPDAPVVKRTRAALA